MRCDEPPPLGGAEGPSPVDVLGAAIGNCLAASLTFCLRRAHVEPAHLTANVVTHLGRDDHGHLRIAGIDVELDSGLDTENAAFKRCAALFEDFCTVTASVRRGIPVSVSLRDRAQSAAWRSQRPELPPATAWRGE
jgi:uncharacterized OsmC-like protein